MYKLYAATGFDIKYVILRELVLLPCQITYIQMQFVLKLIKSLKYSN